MPNVEKYIDLSGNTHSCPQYPYNTPESSLNLILCMTILLRRSYLLIYEIPAPSIHS